MDNTQNKENGSGPLALGLILTVLTGLAAIAVAVFVSKLAGPFWALIPLAHGVQRVVYSSRKGSKKWQPAILGLVLSLVYAGIGAGVYYTHNIEILWAMFLANWLGDTLT